MRRLPRPLFVRQTACLLEKDRSLRAYSSGFPIHLAENIRVTYLLHVVPRAATDVLWRVEAQDEHSTLSHGGIMDVIS